MHLICINYTNSLNKQFLAKKNGVAILFACVLTSMQISRQIDHPTPIETCSQKAQLE